MPAAPLSLLRLLAALATFAACGETADPAATLSVRTSPAWAALRPGDSLRLTVTVVDSRGDTLRRPAVTWLTADRAVATVSARGVVRGVTHGTTTVTARAGDAIARTTIVVAPPVLVGAGDIAHCSRDTDDSTAKLLDTIPGIVFTTGDNAYRDGTTAEFRDCYGPTWGRHRARTRPTPGNHDYHTDDAAPYYAYFGPQAGDSGRGYYSYDFAGWHIIALNSEIDAGPDSPQARWLRADLAATTARCTLAYWHRPLFTSSVRSPWTRGRALWQALYDAGAEIVINGHEHHYERFAPQAPDGTPDPARGIRQFVVGTGGGSTLYEFGSPAPNSEARDNATRGVLTLTLRAAGYSWRFVPAASGTFTDAGSGRCH